MAHEIYHKELREDIEMISKIVCPETFEEIFDIDFCESFPCAFREKCKAYKAHKEAQK